MPDTTGGWLTAIVDMKEIEPVPNRLMAFDVSDGWPVTDESLGAATFSVDAASDVDPTPFIVKTVGAINDAGKRRVSRASTVWRIRRKRDFDRIANENEVWRF